MRCWRVSRRISGATRSAAKSTSAGPAGTATSSTTNTTVMFVGPHRYFWKLTVDKSPDDGDDNPLTGEARHEAHRDIDGRRRYARAQRHHPRRRRAREQAQDRN